MTTIPPAIVDAVQRVLPAVSTDRKHPAALRCVLVERAGDVVRVVATDKHRLTVCERPGDLLPPGTRLLVDPATMTDAGVDADDFPAYERFLAAVGDVDAATIDAAALVDLIEGATDDDAPLRMGVVDGEVVIGEGPVHLDARFAHDAAVAAGPGAVTVEVGGETAPVAFRSATGDLTLVMPVRVGAKR
ncbi:MAG TPA: hypothetical protein VFU93_14820 [Acidimicrobiales bacterium]|nr:hypothetical protein [Acidimicrobiales bacterium]